MTEDLTQRIQQYMREHNVLTLATRAGDLPQAADVFYASDGWTLFFVSDPKSRHAQNMEATGRVAVTIHEDYSDWRVIQGVQLEGEAQRITSVREKVHCVKVYVRKFPSVQAFFVSPKRLAAEVRKTMGEIAWYRIRPRWVRFIDNTRGFGTHEEMEIPLDETRR